MNWLHWALLSALFAGLTAVLAKAGTRDIDANVATAIRTAVVLLLAWGIVFAQGKIRDCSIPRQTLLFLVLSGVATGLSWLCYFRALQLGDASLVAPIDKLSVVVAIVLAVVFLGEKLSLQHCIGGLLIVGGSVVIALR